MPEVRKRSVAINGHRTSYSLEDAFQAELERIAALRGVTVAQLVASVDAAPRKDGGLSSALRVFILRHALDAARVTA